MCGVAFADDGGDDGILSVFALERLSVCVRDGGTMPYCDCAQLFTAGFVQIA